MTRRRPLPSAARRNASTSSSVSTVRMRMANRPLLFRIPSRASRQYTPGFEFHTRVEKLTEITPNSHGGATLRHHLSLTLLALAAIAVLAMAVGTPSDDAPMCVSEFAIADVCAP